MPLRLKLTPRITLFFVAFAVLLLLAVGIGAYRTGQDALQRATTSELLAAEVEKEAAMTAWNRDNQSNLAILSLSLRQYRGLTARDDPAALDRLAQEQLAVELQRWVDGGGFREVLLLEAGSGKVVADTDPSEVGKFKEDMPFFIYGRNGPYVQPPFYSLKLQAPAMLVSLPIQNSEGRLLAVLAGRVDLLDLSDIINRRSGAHQSDDAYLVNSSNLFVTQPRFVSDTAVLQRGAYTSIVNRCLKGESGTASDVDYRDVPVLAVYRWLPDQELCLIVQIDQSEAFAPVQAFGTTLVAISIVALIAASALAFALARTITRPILALQQGAARFGRGEMDTRLPESSGDELGALAQDLNAMAGALAANDATLRTSEAKFSLAFRASPAGVALSRLSDGRYLDANDSYVRMLGYTRAELVGHTSIELEILNTENRARIAQTVRAQGSLRDVEIELRAKSGALISVLCSMENIDLEGEPALLTLTFDISARKRTELALQRKNTELSGLSRLGESLSRLVDPGELLELIHTVIGQLLNNQNLYIALYDDANQFISFPVYTVDGQRISRAARPWGFGLTEYVIRTRLPLFLPRDVMSEARARGIEPQGRMAHCYLAVPLLAGDKVLGVIGIQDYEHEAVYDTGHLEILATIAAQAAIALENARLFTETRRRAVQLQSINDVQQVVSTTLDPDLLSEQIAQVLHSKLKLPAVVIGLIEGDALVFKAASGEIINGSTMIGRRLKIGPHSLTGRAAAGGETLLVPDVCLDPRFMPSEYMPHTRSELVVPLKTQSAIIGVLNIESDKVDAFSPEMVALVETLASQVAIAIENAKLFAETQRLARTDALTGIANRRYLFEVGTQEISRARRFGHPLSALMLDIDHFKLVNDTYGHAVGDQVLQSVARLCKGYVRDIDIVARYGGEEFTILLLETELAGARILAERLRAHVAQSRIVTDQGAVGVTLSTGIADAQMESDGFESLLARADGALYAAKQAGRNRVEVA